MDAFMGVSGDSSPSSFDIFLSNDHKPGQTTFADEITPCTYNIFLKLDL